MMRKHLKYIILLASGSLPLIGQAATDSTLTISKSVEEIEVILKRSSSFVEQQEDRQIVSAEQLKNMPKFLGTSDPLRYMQSLAGIQTNSETSTGLHIQGCDDYQSLVSINGAPVYYPNHLLGLYSTFIAPHFRSISIEQANHSGVAGNRIGGFADFRTHVAVPERFGMEGNIGLVNSDLTLAIPCGSNHALWVSGRTSYLNWLMNLMVPLEDYKMRYYYQDYNLTYSGRLSDADRLVISGFYSRDRMRVNSSENVDIPILWHNIAASAYWDHRMEQGNWRSTLHYSLYGNEVGVETPMADVLTTAMFSSIGLKNRLDYTLADNLSLAASLDYEHYLTRPMYFRLTGIKRFETPAEELHTEHADELSAGVDLRHNVCPWFAYNIGAHASVYVRSLQPYAVLDPRVTLHFYPSRGHAIALHYGRYHQYFHKSGLTSGGLPTDFFFLANGTFLPEEAHAINLRYFTQFYHNQYTITAEVYFKQIFNIAESTGNVLKLLNEPFTFDRYVAAGDGRNYGATLMLQRNTGYVTGYVSYSLGWARRRLPAIEGRDDYAYAASHERRHDLKVVLNSQVAKNWNIGLMFVLASGIPYTKAQEAYMLNGQMVCRYGTYNGAHLPLYHRLDLSVSYDIIKHDDHELGINLSLYNTYAHKNVQFIVYREDLHPWYGVMLSTIIPSISIYGKF